MKRAPVLLALALIVFARPALAQSSLVAQIAGDRAATDRFHFSLKLGLNFSYLAGTVGTGRTGGFNIGLAATIRLSDRLTLVPEIGPFTPKGVSGIPFGTTGDPALDAAFADPAASELALTYIDFPVLVKYRWRRFEVGGGPFVAVLSKARERFRADLSSGETLRFARDVSDGYRSTDFGLAVEASWTVTKPRRGMGLIFHIRYQAGLLDVLKTASPSGPVRNSVIQAAVSFPFVL